MIVAVPAESGAAAKAFFLPQASIGIDVLSDGTLSVRENLTFAFSGSFQGAYRDIPRRPGELISEVSVAKGSATYSAGASTVLGSTDTAGRFGVADLGDETRIVWHYRALDEVRIFTVVYEFTGLAVAYNDAVDVNIQVWGSQWEQTLAVLEAEMFLPPGDGRVYVWGHRGRGSGTTSLGSEGRSPRLDATDLGAGEFAELRVVFPREWLTSTSGALVVPGNGQDAILDEEARYAAESARAASLSRAAIVLALLLAVVPGLLSVMIIYLRYGREPRVVYDREYEQEPPSDHEPALVAALLSQGSVKVESFVGTLFDLIRKGVIGSQPVSYDKSTWLGMRTESITDLELSVTGHEPSMRSFERPVLTIMKRVLAEGPLPLSELRTGVREDASKNAESYTSFKEAVKRSLDRKGLLVDDGKQALVVAVGITVGVLLISFLLSLAFFTGLSREVMKIGIFVAGFTT